MFGFLSAILFGGKYIKEACELTLSADYHDNWKLETYDSDQVRLGNMTQKEFERNMRNGKYRAVDNGIDKKELKHYLHLYITGNWISDMNYGKYNFIKNMTKEEARKKWSELIEENV